MGNEAAERTEDATPRRRQKEREKGKQPPQLLNCIDPAPDIPPEQAGKPDNRRFGAFLFRNDAVVPDGFGIAVV